MENGLIVGVDGGGTHSSLVAVRADGTVVAAGPGRGINYNAIGMEAARERLYDAVNALLTEAKTAEYEAISLGMSALDGPADIRLIREFVGDRFNPECLEMDSDVYMALMGATMGKPGAMVVSGTGAMIVVLDPKGEIHYSAGWGYRLGDPGSAYGVAVCGLQAVMASWEGSAKTTMTNSALGFFQADGKRQLLEKIYAPECEPSRMAQFAREVLKQAVNGDAEAQRVVEENIEYLAAQTARMLRNYSPEEKMVNLYGGMFEHNEWIREMFHKRLAELVPGTKEALLNYPPELGAVVSYLKKRNRLSERVIQRLKETWGAMAHDSYGTL